MKHTVTMGLEHLGVRVETRVAKFCDFLGKEFDTVGGVAEDDRLVDLKFREECVEALVSCVGIHALTSALSGVPRHKHRIE